MAEYLEIKTSRQGKDGKTYWTRIGTMFPAKNGGYKLAFDALPVPTIYEGNVRVEAMAFPPLEKDGVQQRKPDTQKKDDDEIPF